MKWRIVLRYLAILILSVMLVVAVDLCLAYKLTGPGLWSQTTAFALKFRQYIVLEEGKPAVSREGLDLLSRQGAWLQILNQEGYEVYSWRKPPQAPSHYTPSEMVFYNIYSGALEGYTTFCGTAVLDGYKWSYVLGFPLAQVAKYQLVYSPQNLRSYLLVALLSFILVPILVFIVMGYIFGRSLTEPLFQIITAIQQLAQGEYGQWPEKGLYREVFHSLNRLAEALKQSEAERQKTEQMREEWIQNLSHDLKTPLASIKGYGELLGDEHYRFTEEEVKTYARIIRRKAEYMEELLEDLKLAQTLKRGLVPLKRRKEDLVALLREIIVDILNHPRYQKRQIFFHPQQEHVFWPVDKQLLQRALTNLIYNAVIHNDAGTEIHVTIEQADRPRITIRDNGRGISPDDLSKLFQRYYRGTNTEENHQGSGLGLAIAKQIVELHGGSIEVASTLGKGTSFTVTL